MEVNANDMLRTAAAKARQIHIGIVGADQQFKAYLNEEANDPFTFI